MRRVSADEAKVSPVPSLVCLNALLSALLVEDAVARPFQRLGLVGGDGDVDDVGAVGFDRHPGAVAVQGDERRGVRQGRRCQNRYKSERGKRFHCFSAEECRGDKFPPLPVEWQLRKSPSYKTIFSGRRVFATNSYRKFAFAYTKWEYQSP
jgi:hypothetical protein